MRNLRRFIEVLVRGRESELIVALMLTVGRGLTEGIGLLLLVPALGLAGVSVTGAAIVPLAGLVRKWFAAAGLHPTLPVVLIACSVVIVLSALVARWQSVSITTIQARFVAALRGKLYEAIAASGWSFFSRSRPSDFVHALTSELDRVGIATYSLLALAGDLFVASVYILFALKLSALTTTLLLLGGAAIAWTLRGKTRGVQLSGEQLSLITGGFYAATTEHLGATKIAKSYGAEGRAADIFSTLTGRVGDLVVDAVRDQEAARFWFNVASALALIGFLYISLSILKLSTAAILLILFLFLRIVPKLAGMQQRLNMLINHLPAFETVTNLLDRCAAEAEPKLLSREPVELRDSVRLDRVSFAYEGRAPIVNDLTLDIRAGQTTAIVGASGAGKTTVADLVIGLVLPQRGAVSIDGKPLTAEKMGSWREKIGYVTQETFLFNTTVRENLLWAKPDADEAEIARALGSASAAEFVSKLPQGLETVVGDRGVMLSGGERQRLALARALLRRPSLLILDEATSSLDSESEARILRAIEELHGNVTILMITHRLSTVRAADMIYVLEGGSIVESGTWNTLSSDTGGRFYSLQRAQSIDGARLSDIAAPGADVARTARNGG
jgi:ATP-binding cassette subfamily C protein